MILYFFVLKNIKEMVKKVAKMEDSDKQIDIVDNSDNDLIVENQIIGRVEGLNFIFNKFG